jgi:hypothetical protein
MITADKWLHLGIGFAVSFAFGLIAVPLAPIAAALVGWAKEEYDARRPATHTREGWDAWTTMLGTIPALMLLEALQHLGPWL